MTIGSTANIAAAFDVLGAWRGPRALEPVHRLALLLISESFGSGAAYVDASKLHHMLGTGDPSEAISAVEWLARCGLIRLTGWHEDAALAGSVIATEREIAAARDHLGCPWPFENWTGET